MKDEIKEILKYIDQFVYVDQTYNEMKLSKVDGKLILDYITNLQEERNNMACLVNELQEDKEDLKEENERLKEIAHKMHLWIFLHSGDEQKVYDELGLTDEENAMLGYSGQFRIGSDNNE